MKLTDIIRTDVIGRRVASTVIPSRLRTETGIKPVLVTGAPRSGSTWVGHILALSPRLCYVDEPFLPTVRPVRSPLRPYAARQGSCRFNFDTWFTYIDDRNAAAFLAPLRDTIALRYSWPEAARLVTGISTARSFLKGWGHFVGAKQRGSVALVKDPVAVFSAEWLADTFDMNVIVTIRHPLAFVGSLKKASWRFPLQDLVKQELLMSKHLGSFREEMSEALSEPSDLVRDALILHRVIYSVLRDIKPRRPT